MSRLINRVFMIIPKLYKRQNHNKKPIKFPFSNKLTCTNLIITLSWRHGGVIISGWRVYQTFTEWLFETRLASQVSRSSLEPLFIMAPGYQKRYFFRARVHFSVVCYIVFSANQSYEAFQNGCFFRVFWKYVSV